MVAPSLRSGRPGR